MSMPYTTETTTDLAALIGAYWHAARLELLERCRREERASHPPADDEPDESDDDTDVFEPETGDPGAADAPTVRRVRR